MVSAMGPVDQLGGVLLATLGVDTQPAASALHAIVDRFLQLPIAVQILLLVLALPGGMTLLTALTLALRGLLMRRRSRKP